MSAAAAENFINSLRQQRRPRLSRTAYTSNNNTCLQEFNQNENSFEDFQCQKINFKIVTLSHETDFKIP